MASGQYFDQITSAKVLEEQLKKHGYPVLHELVVHGRVKDLPQASSWSTAQLYASRVVVNPVRRDNLNLSVIQDSFQACQSQEQSKIINRLPPDQEDLSETELIQQLGMAGMFWAALHKFTRAPLPQILEPSAGGRGIGSSISISISSSNSSSDMDIDIEMLSDDSELAGDEVDGTLPCMSTDTSTARPQRIRIQNQREGYVPSDQMQVQSSSPLGSQQPLLSSSNHSSRAGHIAASEHTRSAALEDATVQLASVFLRYALAYSPFQQLGGETLSLLLQYEGVRRRLQGSLADRAFNLVAIPDGEINLLYNLGDRFTQPQSSQSRIVALLECKRRFECIIDGKPIITDTVLGQITAEVLACRLSEVSIGFHSELVFFLHFPPFFFDLSFRYAHVTFLYNTFGNQFHLSLVSLSSYWP